MKKTLSIILAVLAVSATLSACGISLSDDTQRLKTETQSPEQEASSDRSEGPTQTKPSDIKLNIAEQLLHESDGIKITVTGVGESIFGTEIKFLIENNTDVDICVQNEYLIINNYMVSDLFSAKVPAGKKTSSSMTITGLDKTGITKIGLIETYMYAINDDTYDRVAEFGRAEIKTNLFDQMDGSSGEGEILFDRDGIKVVAQYINNDSIWGKELVLYTENNTDKDVNLSVEDLSVNDFAISAFGYWKVKAGKKCVEDVTILDSKLEENGIKTVDKIEFKLRAVDPDTYKTLFESDPLTCKPQ